MTMKIIGAFLITIGCGGFGFMIAASHRRETVTLREFVLVLDLMENELRFRHTSLPLLCRITAYTARGVVKQVLLNLALELDKQVTADVEGCMRSALSCTKDVPRLTANGFNLLGKTLGSFDLEGQLQGIASVRSECKRILESHSTNQENRLRCYQTLGICAGAAMAILFI